MEIQFLGTSSGAPTKQRNVTAIVVKHVNAKRWYLVDCGEGTQHQLLHTPLSLQRLEAIFITHTHGDHCFGLFGLLASAAMHGRRKPLTIVGVPEVKAMIDHVQLLSQSHATFDIDFIDVTQQQGEIVFKDFVIDPVELSHRVPCYGYRFKEQPQGPKLDIQKLKAATIPANPYWGLLQKGETVTLEDGRMIQGKDYWLADPEPRQVIIGGDNDDPERLLPYAEHAQVVVHEATYTQVIADKISFNPQHSSAQQVAQTFSETNVPHLILTHFSARYTYENIHEIQDEAEQFYQGRVWLAEDFARFILDRKGNVVKEMITVSIDCDPDKL